MRCDIQLHQQLHLTLATQTAFPGARSLDRTLFCLAIQKYMRTEIRVAHIAETLHSPACVLLGRRARRHHPR